MLEKFGLLVNLNELQRQELEDVCDRRTYYQGDVLFREGDYTDDIYFLISGQVALYKIEPKTQNEIQFKEMDEGQSFGEMSFADGSPRSCSIKAASEEVKVFVLSKQKLIAYVPDSIPILNILSSTINNQVSDYLRYLSNQHTSTLQQKIDELQVRNAFGHFFMFLLICLSAITGVNALLKDLFPDVDVYSTLFNVVYIIVVILLPVVLGLQKTQLSFKNIAFTTHKLNKSLLDGVMFGCLGILITFGTLSLVDTIPALDSLVPGESLVKRFLTWSLTGPRMLIYFVSCYLQQLMRAVVQVTLQKFLSDEKGLYSIALCALIFGMCHAPYGIYGIIITLVASYIFGLVYLRTYNLLGVTLFHFVLGAIAVNMRLL